VLVVNFNALLAVLQLGTAFATGEAVAPVKFPYTLFEAIGVTLDAVTFAQPGAVLDPVDTIAWPAVEPDGFSS
jgi:hypothetical protein